VTDIVNLAIRELRYGLIIPKELFDVEGGGYLVGEANHNPVSPDDIYSGFFVVHHHKRGLMLSRSKSPPVKVGWPLLCGRHDR
jgi:hypothetical protein